MRGYGRRGDLVRMLEGLGEIFLEGRFERVWFRGFSNMVCDRRESRFERS